MERLHKRIDDVEKAKNNCRVLNEILAYCNTEPMSERESELAAVCKYIHIFTCSL